MRTSRGFKTVVLAATLALLASLLIGVPAGAVTVIGGEVELVSRSLSGAGGNRHTLGTVAVSGDGSIVAFESDANDLVPGDTNGAKDVFVLDRDTGDIERVSVATDGTQGNALSLHPSISADGTRIAFETASNNLGGTFNGGRQVYVRDLRTNTTIHASTVHLTPHALDRPGGTTPSISADGNHVVFQTNTMVRGLGAAGGSFVIMKRDLRQAHSVHVDFTHAGGPPINSEVLTGGSVSDFADVSADGRYVVFESRADNLVPNDTNGERDVFWRDMQGNEIRRVSVHSNGSQTRGNGSDRPHISGDGMRVTFWSNATDLVDNDDVVGRDVFLHRIVSSTTELVSVEMDGTAGGGQDHDISQDGSKVVFWGAAAGDHVVDENIANDPFVRDVDTGQIQPASFTADGSQARSHLVIGGELPAISADGSTVAFVSRSDEMPGTDGLYYDAFAADLPPLPPPNLRCAGALPTIVGTPGADTIVGTSGPDVIVGLGGNDVINAGGGDDIICAGDGNDNVRAGGGADRVDAGRGRDTVRGGGGNDVIKGQGGNDKLIGQGGNDRITGGGGNDTIKGNGGNDNLKGNGGNDNINGGRGRDRCRGNGGTGRLRSCER